MLEKKKAHDSKETKMKYFCKVTEKIHVQIFKVSLEKKKTDRDPQKGRSCLPFLDLHLNQTST